MCIPYDIPMRLWSLQLPSMFFSKFGQKAKVFQWFDFFGCVLWDREGIQGVSETELARHLITRSININ